MDKKIKRVLKSNKITCFLLWPIISYRSRKAKKKQDIRRQFLEEISQKVKGGQVEIDIPDYLGTFQIDIRSDLLHRILLFNEYESQIAQLITQYVDKDKDAIDIGANIGLHTILFSKLLNKSQKVLAIEPTQNALKYLYNNLKLNKSGENVIVYEGVAVNKSGEYEMSIIEGKEEYSAIDKIYHPEAVHYQTRQIKVNGNSIDNLVEEYHLTPGFIKIDTEGAEALVFEGAHRTISKFKPIIISELSENLIEKQNHNISEIFDFLRNCGYRILNAATGNEIVTTIEGNFIAIPLATKL